MKDLKCLTPLLVLVLVSSLQAQNQSSSTKAQMRVGLWSYQNGKTAVCFSNQFLTLLAREAKLDIQRKMVPVPLSSDNTFKYPIAVMSGNEHFDLSAQEKKHLGKFISNGGFLIASAGCSHKQWGLAFQKTMSELDTKKRVKLKTMPLSHDLFHTLFDIDRLLAKEAAKDIALRGIYLGDKLVGIYSPMGLNDTKHAGGGCCCCGSNELKDADRILSNIVLYALLN